MKNPRKRFLKESAIRLTFIKGTKTHTEKRFRSKEVSASYNQVWSPISYSQIFFILQYIEHDANGQNGRFEGGKRRSEEDEKADLERQLMASMSATVTSKDGRRKLGFVSTGVILKSGENEGKPVTGKGNMLSFLK